ncbi:MAG: riboflavin synthase [Bdellovibrionota bacterium]|nr:MAG: riboflavin synthase [Pseudomonadota bacterium]
MFTGLVERVGRIAAIHDKDGFKVLTVSLSKPEAYATQLGESIAINGCCLTVTQFDQTSMSFDVSFESLDKTNLGSLQLGSPVNLERALRMGDRLGGHMVSGHVDGRAMLTSIEEEEGGWNVFVEIPRDMSGYLIPKGSITLDGTSLTINGVEDLEHATRIRLTLIPLTMAHTTFGQLKAGWPLNVEVDLVGKYLERFASPYVQAGRAPKS